MAQYSELVESPGDAALPITAINDTVRQALEDAERLNNRLRTLVRIGLLLHPLLLVAALVSPFAIYKSRALVQSPAVQGQWARLSRMSRRSLMELANYQGEDAILARFRLSYRYAYEPILIAAGYLYIVYLISKMMS